MKVLTPSFVREYICSTSPAKYSCHKPTIILLMGGEAAKERRRLKRLNDGEGGGDITSTNAKDTKPVVETTNSDAASKKRTKVDSGGW